jgi:hypothetical protein
MAALPVWGGLPALDPSGIDVERIQAPAHGVIDDVHETVCSIRQAPHADAGDLQKAVAAKAGGLIS